MYSTTIKKLKKYNNASFIAQIKYFLTGEDWQAHHIPAQFFTA